MEMITSYGAMPGRRPGNHHRYQPVSLDDDDDVASSTEENGWQYSKHDDRTAKRSLISCRRLPRIAMLIWPLGTFFIGIVLIIYWNTLYVFLILNGIAVVQATNISTT